jgi:hypothetical protein
MDSQGVWAARAVPAGWGSLAALELLAPAGSSSAAQAPLPLVALAPWAARAVLAGWGSLVALEWLAPVSSGSVVLARLSLVAPAL